MILLYEAGIIAARGGAEAGVVGRAGRRPLAGMTGAGFWRRYAACSLDAALLAVPSLLLCWPLLRRAAAALARDYPAVLELAGHGMGQADRTSTRLNCRH